jgi:hypothetical protein
MDAGLAVGIAGVAIGAIGLAWGLVRHVAARRDRARREELEAELQRPEVVVKLSAYGRESNGLQRIQATVAVANKGPTMASDVRFGLKVYGDDVPAGELPVLGIDESHRASVFLPRKLEAQMRNRGARLEDAAYAWARFTDNRGRHREVSTT